MAPKRKHGAVNADTTTSRVKKDKQMLKVVKLQRSLPTVKAQDSSLLDLPNELLTHILSIVLVDPSSKPVTLHSASQRRWRDEIHKLTDNSFTKHVPEVKDYAVPAIAKSCLLNCLLTCRAFYFAGVEAFYGGNTLKFDSTKDLLQMTKALDTDRRRHIASVEISPPAQSTTGYFPGNRHQVFEFSALEAAAGGLPALKQVVLEFQVRRGTENGAVPVFIRVARRALVAEIHRRFDGSFSIEVAIALNGQRVRLEDLDEEEFPERSRFVGI